MSFQSQKDDIKKRLMFVAAKGPNLAEGTRELLREAADKIEQLEREVDHWRDAYSRRTQEFATFARNIQQRQQERSTTHGAPTSQGQPSNSALAHALDRFLAKAMNRH